MAAPGRIESLSIIRNCESAGTLRSRAVFRANGRLHTLPIRVGLVRDFETFRQHVFASLGVVVSFFGREGNCSEGY